MLRRKKTGKKMVHKKTGKSMTQKKRKDYKRKSNHKLAKK